MKFTHINGNPYSEDLLERMEEEKREYLRREMAKGVTNPYSVASTEDIMTIRFEDGDMENARGLCLPLQTNHIQVSNSTEYKGKPQWNWVKDFRVGKLESVGPEELQARIERFAELPIADLSLQQSYGKSQGSNSVTGEPATSESGISIEIVPEGATLEDRLRLTQSLFAEFPEQFKPASFRIDPTSHVRVERRRLKKGGELYSVFLGLQTYMGLAGAPAITNRMSQTITAKVA